jgi:hypothetical protein
MVTSKGYLKKVRPRNWRPIAWIAAHVGPRPRKSKIRAKIIFHFRDDSAYFTAEAHSHLSGVDAIKVIYIFLCPEENHIYSWLMDLN